MVECERKRERNKDKERKTNKCFLAFSRLRIYKEKTSDNIDFDIFIVFTSFSIIEQKRFSLAIITYLLGLEYFFISERDC